MLSVSDLLNALHWSLALCHVQPVLSLSFSEKSHVSVCLQEYKLSHDVKEAESRLRFLAVPFFHHELVKQALILAMDEAAVESAILDLFMYLNDTGTVSLSQMVKVRLHGDHCLSISPSMPCFGISSCLICCKQWNICMHV